MASQGSLGRNGELVLVDVDLENEFPRVPDFVRAVENAMARVDSNNRVQNLPAAKEQARDHGQEQPMDQERANNPEQENDNLPAVEYEAALQQPEIANDGELQADGIIDILTRFYSH